MSSSPPPPPAPGPFAAAHEAEFRIEEFKALRKQIEIMLDEERKREQYTVLAVAAIFTWLTTTREHFVPAGLEGMVWWLPLVVVIGALFQEVAAFRTYGSLGQYLRRIEAEFASAGRAPAGWEHHLAPRHRAINLGYKTLAWTALVAFAVSVPLIRTFGPTWTLAVVTIDIAVMLVASVLAILWRA